MSLEQYKDANRKELWEIIQIQQERIAELEATIERLKKSTTPQYMAGGLDNPR